MEHWGGNMIINNYLLIKNDHFKEHFFGTLMPIIGKVGGCFSLLLARVRGYAFWRTVGNRVCTHSSPYTGTPMNL